MGMRSAVFAPHSALRAQPVAAPVFTAQCRSRQFAAKPEDDAVEELEAKIKELYNHVEEVIDKRVNIKKDSTQAAKRHHTDLENETKYGITKFAHAYLQIPDNLERAAGSVKDEDIAADPELKKMQDSVLKMQKIVNQAMKEFGIRK